MKNPCHNCPKRYPGCHGKCDDYKAWKADWDKKKQAEKLKANSGVTSRSQRYHRPYSPHKIRGDQ